MTTTRRINSIIVSALAVMSLFVSSVSACACAHHQEEAESAAPSCHSQSHSTHGEAQNTESKTSIDEGCTCFVKVPSPYVLTKSGKKKVADQNTVAEIPVTPCFAEGLLEIAEQPAVLTFAAANVYLSRFTAFRPSRAPPRL